MFNRRSFLGRLLAVLGLGSAATEAAGGWDRLSSFHMADLGETKPAATFRFTDFSVSEERVSLHTSPLLASLGCAPQVIRCRTFAWRWTGDDLPGPDSKVGKAARRTIGQLWRDGVVLLDLRCRDFPNERRHEVDVSYYRPRSV